jgi:hypothetical protein
MTEIIALIKCLPAIVGLLQEISKFVRTTFGDDPVKRFQEAQEAFKSLNEARTSEERVHAAQKLQDALQHIPQL